MDGSKKFKVNAERDDQFESIYIHHCTDVLVRVGTDNPIIFPVDIDDPERQYVINWENEGGANKLTCQKVIRDGICPTTEKTLTETVAKEKEFSEKMATMMVDSNKVTTKPKDSNPKGGM